MAIDPITLALPTAIVGVVESFGSTLGTDTIEASESYQEQSKIEDGAVVVQVYPLTRQKREHGKAGARTIEVSIYVAISRKCAPKEKTKLKESIQYAMDLSDLFDGYGSELPGLGSNRVAFQPNEDETFLWFPEMLNKKNKFVALIELRYAWKSRVEITEG